VVLALEDCLGDRHGHLQPYDAALNDDMPASGGFVAIGYSAGRQMVDSNCSVRLGGDNGIGATMLNDCATLPGDSGAPIVRRGTGRVVAIISSFHAGFASVNCSAIRSVVHENWNPQCTNAAVPLSVTLIDRIEAVKCAIQVQNLLLRLGYDAGPYGVIDQPLLARAIKQVQLEIGMVPSGELSGNLSEILKMRTLGI
jgi:hypothetical protein